MDNSWISVYWLAPLVGWLTAHIIKFLLTLAKGRAVTWRIFFVSGGMPSSHSSVMMALATVVGMREGFGSAFFGIAIVLAVLIMYDAINLRGAVGSQGHALQELAKKAGLTIVFRLADGHTLKEVLAGGLLGVVVGLLMLQIL